MKRSLNRSIVAAIAGVISAGCQISVTPGSFTVVPPVLIRGPVIEAPVVEAQVVAGPVFTAPGVEVIQVEPDPSYRVYMYDPGYPPGAYFYGDYYWYNGYRYPHDVFINRYVTENIRENRFINVEENRRAGRRMEAHHRNEFAKTHGVSANAQHANRPGERPGQRSAERLGSGSPNVERQAEHSSAKKG